MTPHSFLTLTFAFKFNLDEQKSKKSSHLLQIRLIQNQVQLSALPSGAADNRAKESNGILLSIP